MTIGIVDNNFEVSTKQSGYIKLNKEFFCNSLYKELCAGEIRVMLYLMFKIDKVSYSQNVELKFYGNNYKNIAKQLDITERMAKKYIKGLLSKKFINIEEDKVKGYISVGMSTKEILNLNKDIKDLSVEEMILKIREYNRVNLYRGDAEIRAKRTQALNYWYNCK